MLLLAHEMLRNAFRISARKRCHVTNPCIQNGLSKLDMICCSPLQLRMRDVPEEKYSNAFIGYGDEDNNFVLEVHVTEAADAAAHGACQLLQVLGRPCLIGGNRRMPHAWSTSGFGNGCAYAA